MNKKNIIKKLFVTLALGSMISFGACKDKTFEAPNKENVVTGEVKKLFPVTGSSMDFQNYADQMAKVWDENPVLVSINGVDLSSDGINKANMLNSRWIYTYYSDKKAMGENNYVVTFNGLGDSTWLQTSESTPNTPVGNYSVDSRRAISTARENGLDNSVLYSMELFNRENIIQWVVGAKKTQDSVKYDIVKINAQTGEIIK